MKTAYFDCTYGAGGDMLLAALIDTFVDSGISIDLWLNELNKIALPKDSYKITIEPTKRSSISAKKLKVIAPQNHHQQDHRGLKEISQIIESSQFSLKASKLALSIFTNLALAEAEVHGISLEEVHFHEVGAIDSIIDIVGFALAYDLLQIEQSIVSRLPLGSGTARTAHGLLPVPGPAVLALLKKAKAPISNFKIEYECLTPTATAILTTIANNWGQAPSLQSIDATGYGAGDFDPEHFPNICRVLIGITSTQSQQAIAHSLRFNQEQLAVIEVMLDDLSPQILAYTAERLLETGALDAYITPVTAKKGRSGHLLTALCKPEDAARLEESIFDQTSTLGLRVYLTDRLFLEREWLTVSLNNDHLNNGQNKNNQIRIKIARDSNGKIINAQPEYEDCAVYAKAHGLPLKEVINQALNRCNFNSFERV